MAAVTEKPGGNVLLGRNIFGTNHVFSSPMTQLKILPASSLSVKDFPSPDPEQEDPNDVTAQARLLARDFVIYKTKPTPSKPRNKAAITLRRIGDEMVDRHQTIVYAMKKRLQLSNPSENAHDPELSLEHRLFLQIANGMYKDRQDNWGRVVTLFVLGGILALNNMEQEGGDNIENIIQFVGDYVGTQKKSWIEKNGGWAGFVKFFDDGASEDKKVWKGLMFAFGIGGAIASLVGKP